MRIMKTITSFVASALALSFLIQAQQYAGDLINNSLPQVPGAEIAYFRIPDPAGKNNNLTLINYYSRNSTGQRLIESRIQRAVIVIHGLNRDPGTYESNALSALHQVPNPDINFDTVAVIAPYFANGDDKNVGYPWTTGLAAGLGSTTNALVWPGSQWAAGGNAQYPNSQKNTISSYYILDTLVRYFDNATLFPNIKQIVVAGHSLGAQTVHRYAAIGNQLSTRSPVTYWVANPNSYIWLNTSRPFDMSNCPTYDNYRDGYTNFTQYPMTYATSLVAQGRPAILANFHGKGVAFARGLQDLGDDSSSCAPFTTGGNRNERFFNFIKTFPPACSDSASRSCDTVDLINVGHDSGQMMASPAGQARLFIDNFYGDKKRAFDFGYPRVQAGDDPYPDPSFNGTVATINNRTYAGNMSYHGCFSDQTPPTLPYFAFDNSSNSIIQCSQVCNSLNYSIAGVEYGSQCFCGNALSSKAQRVVESSCSFPCAANASENCGGFSRVSIISRGIPLQLPPPSNPDTLGTWNFLNCYTEGVNGRALSAAATTSDRMTLDSCATFCGSYKYFGTEFGSECYCGNSFGASANVTNKNECSKPCSGNNLQLCGASYRLSVYIQTAFGTSQSSPEGASSTGSTTSSSTPASCPASNGTIITSHGSTFFVECFIDHLGRDMANVGVETFQQCIDACATTRGCVDVSLSGMACYLKSALGERLWNANIWGARYLGAASTSTIVSTSSAAVTSFTSQTSLTSAPISSTSLTSESSSQPGSSISSSATTTFVIVTASSAVSSSSAVPSLSPITCPGSNNTLIGSNGSRFLVECFVDRYGGDIGHLAVSSFTQCIDVCAMTKGCLDISLAGNTCYMKNQLGVAISNNGVWGARSVGSVSSSTSNLSTPSNAATFSATYATSSVTTTASTLVITWSTASSAVVSSSAGQQTSSNMIVESSSSLSTSTSTITVLLSSTSSSMLSPSVLAMTSTSSITPTTSTTTATATSSSPAFSSLGCYVDGGTRSLPISAGSSSKQTPQQCALRCQSQGYRYSGTEYSSECWCSNTAPVTKAADTDCKSSCSGDTKQVCGGGFRLSVYVDTKWTQTLYARQSYKSWSLAGCYQDAVRSRTLPQIVGMSGGASNATIINCLVACAAKGFSWCGAEYYNECYGSNAAPATKVQPGIDVLSAGCNYPCAGNNTEACGGADLITVYYNNGTWP